jgi:hypothetical protein
MAMWKLGGLALAAVLTAGSAIGQASAMPVNGLASPATAAAAANRVQESAMCADLIAAGGGRAATITVLATTTIMSGRGLIGTGTDATGGRR